MSQRPARVDKNLLANCSTQAILKVTNPNDLKSITSSVEGITKETENEIINLHVGTAMIVGIADMPLFVKVRPRKTKHGGETIDVVSTFSEAKIEGELTNLESYIPIDNKKEVINIIKPKIKKEDIRLLVDKPIKSIATIVVPCVIINCKEKNFSFNVLVNLDNGHLVKNYEVGTGEGICGRLDKLSERENKVFSIMLSSSQEITAADVFSKSGLMFSEVYDTVNNLVKKGYLEKKADKYAFSRLIELLSNLKENACYEKTEFIGLEYDKKIEAKYKINEILDFLKRFVNIINYKECYLVKYDVEY